MLYMCQLSNAVKHKYFFSDKHIMKPQHIWAKYSDLIHWGVGYASALEAFETALCFMTEAPLKKGFQRMSQVGVLSQDATIFVAALALFRFVSVIFVDYEWASVAMPTFAVGRISDCLKIFEHGT